MRNKVFVSLFAVLLLALAIANIAAPKKEFSDNENRMLASFPKLTVESLKDGSFTADFATYLADHFVLRDWWVSVKAFAEEAMGKTSNNGVYKGKDGYLIDSFDEESAAGFLANCQSVKEFIAFTKETYGIDTKTIIAPTATQILSQKLPPFAVTADGNALLDEAEKELDGFINLMPVMESHKDEYVYYRTDHHWTNLGAYYAYTEYKKACGEQAEPFAYWESETVSDCFFGTTYSRYGLFDGKNADIVCAPSEKALGSMTVTNSKGEVSSSIYFPEKATGKDKYLYFLGGNDSLVTVDTQTQNGKTLLLIKDSYANSFLPYLIGDYQKILLVDMRYYMGIIPDLIAENGVTDILILYNLKSFAEDTYIQYINFTE